MTVPDRVLVGVPGWCARLMLARGASMSSPPAGWGPVLRVDQGGALVTVDLQAPAFRQLIIELSQAEAPDRPMLYAAIASDWQAVDVVGRRPHEIIETLRDRLHTPQTAGNS